MPVVPTLTKAAEARLRQPRSRGMFEPIDAARRELGLLSVGDDQGQMRVYWLVDLPTSRIEDARFLAFGSLSSHPLADAFCERVKGLTVPEACALPAEAIDALLRDEPSQPALDAEARAPLAVIQARALAALPTLKLLPKPVEKQRYERKRELEWDERDRAWLPLSLLKKIGKVQGVLDQVLKTRLNLPSLTWSVDSLNDDFLIRVKLGGISAEQKETVLLFFQSALREGIHSHIQVTEAA